MAGHEERTPRVFLIRHGQTEWTLTGQHTGRSDIPLTEEGKRQASTSGRMVVGPGKALDPQKIAAVFVSPRTRARQTFELMFDDTTRATLADKTEVTEDIREWDYGRYEGKLKKDIVADRAARGVDVDRAWDIWLDGCEDGESPAQISERLDRLIAKIKQIQGPYMNCEKDVDVVIVAHGHSLRAFTKRWLELDLAKKLPLLLEPGALGVLSYEHHNVNEPALSLGVNLGSH